MNRPSAAMAIGTLILLCLVEHATARPVKIWSAEELTEKADLVLIGIASETGDAADQADQVDAKPETWVVVDTSFTVKSLLKGELKAPTVNVEHRRYQDPTAEVTVMDGPAFVRFSTTQPHEYLMFLKQGEGGRYEPVTGQYDPSDSFLLLQKYHPSGELPAQHPATTQPVASDLDRAVAIAASAAKGKAHQLSEYALISAQRIIVEGRYIWLITWKPARLLPADPSKAPMGLGGEIFVSVDLSTGQGTVRYGE